MFRSEAPSHLPGDLLFGLIAYQLQADAFGDLDPVTRKGRRRQFKEGTSNPTFELACRCGSSEAVTGTGSTLMREWNGRQHRVMAMADGYAWNGKTYKSLSQIAFAITGTKWNGPRFFGLRDVNPPMQNAEASS